MGPARANWRVEVPLNGLNVFHHRADEEPMSPPMRADMLGRGDHDSDPDKVTELDRIVLPATDPSCLDPKTSLE